MHRAMYKDGSNATHPIINDVHTESEINNMFDDISYNKVHPHFLTLTTDQMWYNIIPHSSDTHYIEKKERQSTRYDVIMF